ncbi:MAG: hypothetical protein AAGA96_18920 [Verrucomicrobiota bacterium]
MKPSCSLPNWIVVLSLLICLSALSPSRGQEARVWTDATGRQVTAALAEFKDANTVILRLQDGRLAPFAISQLSEVDQAYAREQFSLSQLDWENPNQSETYVIRGMRRENVPGYISTKGGWEWQLKCVEVRIEYKGSGNAKYGDVSAYFYDRNGKLIQEFKSPPRVQDEDGKYIDAKDMIPSGKTVETYFPLTEFLEESDWATVLVAFGQGYDYSVDSMPLASYEKLDFPQKAYVFPEWSMTESESTDSAEAPDQNISLEVRRVAEGDYKYSMVFNGDYKSGRPSISAEVRVLGDVAPGEGKVRLHAFNESGTKVVTRRGPSIAKLRSGEYVGNPKVADNRWHEVYFAVDRDLELKNYPTYVVVFEFGGKFAAGVMSSVGATLESLDFPEKGKLESAP